MVIFWQNQIMNNPRLESIAGWYRKSCGAEETHTDLLREDQRPVGCDIYRQLYITDTGRKRLLSVTKLDYIPNARSCTGVCNRKVQLKGYYCLRSTLRVLLILKMSWIGGNGAKKSWTTCRIEYRNSRTVNKYVSEPKWRSYVEKELRYIESNCGNRANTWNTIGCWRQTVWVTILCKPDRYVAEIFRRAMKTMIVVDKRYRWSLSTRERSPVKDKT